MDSNSSRIQFLLGLEFPNTTCLPNSAAGGLPRCRVRVLGVLATLSALQARPQIIIWMLLLCAALLLAVGLAYGYLAVIYTVAAVVTSVTEPRRHFSGGGLRRRRSNDARTRKGAAPEAAAE